MPSIATSLPGNGDPLRLRGTLAEHGVTFNAIYTGEVLGNASGGLRRGAIGEGKLEVNATVDMERLAGWSGLRLYGNAFQIHRTGGISRDLVGAVQTISAIEALPSTRLSELWLEQNVGTMSLRVGQLTADSEFTISSYSLLFLNSDFPAITKQNLPGTGPAYPLSTPGARLKWQPSEAVSLLGAVFNGNPAGRGDDPERLNRNGTNFRLSDPPLLWSELQLRANQDAEDTGLASIVRFGGWYHTGRFDSQRFDRFGRSLADPASTGLSARLRSDSGIYAILDQQIYRLPGGDSDKGIAVFSRVSASPSDRNLIDAYLDGGIVFSGLNGARPNDKFGVTFLYSHLSNVGRGLDRDFAALSPARLTRRDYELAIEATYLAEIRPGWSIQPDLQYVIHPGGRIPQAAGDPTPKNATIIGLRTTVVY